MNIRFLHPTVSLPAPHKGATAKASRAGRTGWHMHGLPLCCDTRSKSVCPVRMLGVAAAHLPRQSIKHSEVRCSIPSPRSDSSSRLILYERTLVCDHNSRGAPRTIPGCHVLMPRESPPIRVRIAC